MKKHMASYPTQQQIMKFSTRNSRNLGSEKAIVWIEASFEEKYADLRTDVYLRKVRGSWLVDWKATTGKNDITIPAFIAANTGRETTLRIEGKFSTVYFRPYSLAEDQYYCIRLTESYGSESLHGYVTKNSDTGKRIYSLLQDGQKHAFTIRCQRQYENASAVEITSLVNENWFVD